MSSVICCILGLPFPPGRVWAPGKNEEAGEKEPLLRNSTWHGNVRLHCWDPPRVSLRTWGQKMGRTVYCSPESTAMLLWAARAWTTFPSLPCD